MTKEQILEKNSEKGSLFGEVYDGNTDAIYASMDEYAKQEAIAYSNFRTDYKRIEAMNVRHDQNERFGGQMYSWIGASDDVIWQAYKKGEQLKRHFEK